jgi:integrase
MEDVDALLPKPKLPRRPKKKARFFTLTEVARIIAASEADHRVFYWLAPETGLRGGELAGLKLTDIDEEQLTVNRSVWHAKEQKSQDQQRHTDLGAIAATRRSAVGTDRTADGKRK